MLCFGFSRPLLWLILSPELMDLYTLGVIVELKRNILYGAFG